MPSSRSRSRTSAAGALHVVARPTKVLLVEDNRDNATAIAELLRIHGYVVDVAYSVAAALQEAKKGFDVLVSDIGLPDGTGRDLMHQLGSRGEVRGIALTGYGTDADVRQNTQAGFSRHLTKPVDPDELLAAIADLAGGNGQSVKSPARRRRG
jgi:CheY-like chemotaxis protein